MKIIIAILLVLTCGCTSMHHGPTREIEHREIEHIVVVWLKQPHNEFQRKQLIERSFEFRKIPGVVCVKGGEVLPSDRMMVDSSYDVAIVITFDSEQSLRAYDQNPIHLKAVNELLKPLAAKVVIYDFTNR